MTVALAAGLLLLAAALILGLSAYVAGWPAVTRGLLLGSLFSLLNFLLTLGSNLVPGLFSEQKLTTA